MTKPVTWTPGAAEALERIRGRLFATTTEASLILGLDVRTLRSAIAAGQVPAVKAGNTYRIPTQWILEKARLQADGRAGAA